MLQPAMLLGASGDVEPGTPHGSLHCNYILTQARVNVITATSCTVSMASVLQDDPVYANNLTDPERLLLWEQGTCPTSQVRHAAAHYKHSKVPARCLINCVGFSRVNNNRVGPVSW